MWSPVGCSSLRRFRIQEKHVHFCLLIMQCACLSDTITCSSLRRFLFREKIEFRILVKSMLLLNRKELESVFYIKIERLDDTYPMVYRLHRSDKRIKKIYAKTSAAHTRAAHHFLNSFKTAKNLKKCSTYGLFSYSIRIQRCIIHLVPTDD